VLDRDGVDLADVEEAAAEAARRGREMAPADAVVIADETWSPMFEIPLDDDGGADPSRRWPPDRLDTASKESSREATPRDPRPRRGQRAVRGVCVA